MLLSTRNWLYLSSSPLRNLAHFCYPTRQWRRARKHRRSRGQHGVIAVTTSYYPDSRSASEAAERYGMELGNEAISNVFQPWIDELQSADRRILALDSTGPGADHSADGSGYFSL